MNGDTYNIGVQLALADAGLVKEAGPATAGLKRVGMEALEGIKNYFTAAKLRKALAAYSTTPVNPGHAIDPTKIHTALGHLAIGQKPEVELARQALEEAMQASPHTLARREVFKATLPYAVPLGAAGAGYAVHKGIKSLYPKTGD